MVRLVKTNLSLDHFFLLLEIYSEIFFKPYARLVSNDMLSWLFNMDSDDITEISGTINKKNILEQPEILLNQLYPLCKIEGYGFFPAPLGPATIVNSGLLLTMCRIT